ncbi:molybdate ABC transporter permease subunit [Arcanobacterium phocisimile]|uniref:Molybdate ABC transporter permease subunit n=1 Tax=Arcanobacterium phocisimile TaxID=1302235 RepID=A0ABX7IIN0_9ACTO|nr:ABC transporter permease [Arcanobacterium phocisimile]QRV01703.1 molybdate ABC transporter permease subunit [Arcanobacterium phocisimile]
MQNSQHPLSHSQQLAYAPWLLVPAIVGLLFLIFPIFALLLSTPWVSIIDLLHSPEATDALWLSVKSASIATLLTTVFGVPLAFAIARSKQWQGKLLRILVLLPLTLPPVVSGLALMLVWGRRGMLGYYLDIAGYSISFSTIAVIFSQIFVSLPFLVITFEAAIRTHGTAYEDTAVALGASRTRTFFTVSLPLLAPALISSMALAFSRALGEFGATITFAGSLQGITRTMPIQIYLQRELDTDQALALAVILISIALVMLVIGSVRLPLFRISRIRSLPLKNPQDYSHEQRNSQATSAPEITVQASIKDRDFNVSTTFKANTITVINGPNGSGKSTLLNLIAGNIVATHGGVTFTPPHPRVSLLQQNPYLFPHLNVVQNVEFSFRCRGFSRTQARARAMEELSFVGIETHALQDVRQLSGGEAQRVAIARAMATEPNVVLLDEPFTALDETTARKLRVTLRKRLQAESVTALIVSHDRQDTEYFAHSLLQLQHGKIISHE